MKAFCRRALYKICSRHCYWIIQLALTINSSAASLKSASRDVKTNDTALIINYLDFEMVERYRKFSYESQILGVVLLSCFYYYFTE